MIVEQGQTPPEVQQSEKSEEIVRKIVVKRPGREEVYHIGLKADEQDGTIKINLGDDD